MHVVIARNMIALSGLAQQLDVWTGHSRYLLPRLVEQHRHGKLQSFGAVLMDTLLALAPLFFVGWYVNVSFLLEGSSEKTVCSPTKSCEG